MRRAPPRASVPTELSQVVHESSAGTHRRQQRDHFGPVLPGQLVEDIMGAVAFLASDASALVTGTALLVDVGWTAE